MLHIIKERFYRHFVGRVTVRNNGRWLAVFLCFMKHRNSQRRIAVWSAVRRI